MSVDKIPFLVAGEVMILWTSYDFHEEQHSLIF